MSPRAIAHVFGTLLLVTAGSMLLPVICSLWYREGDLLALVLSACITAGAGFPLWFVFRKRPELTMCWAAGVSWSWSMTWITAAPCRRWWPR